MADALNFLATVCSDIVVVEKEIEHFINHMSNLIYFILTVLNDMAVVLNFMASFQIDMTDV